MEVPSALLDFGMKTIGDNRPRDPFSGLLMLKRQLVGHGLHFPLYDFTCVLYLERTNQLTPERLRNIFPPEETEFITDIADLIHNSKTWAIGKTVLTIFNKHSQQWRGWLARYLLQRKLHEEQVEQIAGMDLQAGLIDELPHLFAEDLNAAVAVQRTERLVLFFDTHEAFWGDQRTREFSKEALFQRDEWFRRLVGELNLRDGIIVVVAGREPPRWNEPGEANIPLGFIYHKEVGLLSVSDARHFLERAGIEDAGMCKTLISHAQVQRSEVHPYLLGLCADIALAASIRGEELTPEEFNSHIPSYRLTSLQVRPRQRKRFAAAHSA